MGWSGPEGESESGCQAVSRAIRGTGCVCVQCVCAHKSVFPDFVIPPNVFSRKHHNAGGYDFFMILIQRVFFFFYIKFYVSSSPSYCWAIRPPLSFSFFLCPFALQPPVSLPPLRFYFLFCLFCSLSLPSPSLILSGFCCMSLSSLRLSLPFLSLKALVADGSRALITPSLFPSRAGHTLLALVTDCPQLPETSILNDSRQEAFVWDGDGERERKTEGLCNHSAAQLTGSLTCFLLR